MPAWAGTYLVRACGPEARFANNSWTIHNSVPVVASGVACGQAGDFGGIYVRETLFGPSLPMDDGDRADMRFDAPVGTQIASISISGG